MRFYQQKLFKIKKYIFRYSIKIYTLTDLCFIYFKLFITLKTKLNLTHT